jgi:hypothetical protein
VQVNFATQTSVACAPLNAYPCCVAAAAAAAATAVECRAADGRFPYALLRRDGKDFKFCPQTHLIKKITSCDQSLSQQEKQQFMACCVGQMRLVPRTKKPERGFPDGTFKDNAPFTYE